VDKLAHVGVVADIEFESEFEGKVEVDRDADKLEGE